VVRVDFGWLHSDNCRNDVLISPEVVALAGNGLPPWATRQFPGELSMPLDPKMLNSVVRINSAGDFQGTGFIIGVASERFPGRRWPYVITANHVVERQIEIELEVGDPLTHGELLPPIPIKGWRQPLAGVDLSVAPFPEDRVPRFQGFPLENFIPEGEVVPLGGQICYLGIFAPLGVPMGRSATLGALDIQIEKPEYSYQADLVDCRSYRGFSGSPCFYTKQYAVLDPTKTPASIPPLPDGTIRKVGHVTEVVSFCGMFTAHYSDEKAADAEGVVSRYGVGIMLPCDDIREALMTDEAQRERRVLDEQHAAAKAAEHPPLENAGAQQPSEWDNFEALTRKLVSPKPS